MIRKSRTVTKRLTAKDRYLRLSMGDLEALCLGMGAAAWEMMEAADVERALQRVQRVGRTLGIPNVDVPWRYQTITPMGRLALQLYATGLFPLLEAVGHTHPGVSEGRRRGIARTLLRLVHQRHPAVVRAMTEGYLSMKAPLEELQDAKLQAAEESLAFLRACLADEKLPAGQRIQIATDFLDRTPETAKVSRNETKTTHVGGLQMPADAAARLAQAAERATRLLVRSPEELRLAARGTDLDTVPEAEVVAPPARAALEAPADDA